MAFPPDSPLSSLEGSIASEDGHETEEDGTLLRPSKRQKTDGGSAASSSATAALMPEPEAEVVPGPDPLEGLSDVSSDTSGDIPSSPVSACLDLEDFQEQVTACEWDGCDAGDQRNMDRLVEHIHNSHIESRQKKYTCEWTSCSRKGLPHASGYALKAHMRSHTREKPFYCYLPECDRSFTRSDALAKHMRTVHETEALRPSDPVPRGHGAPTTTSTGTTTTTTTTTGTTKPGKLKIIIKTPQSHGGGDDMSDESGANGHDHEAYFTPMPADLFSAGELAGSVEKLYRKCYWEAKWAGEVGEALRKESAEWEAVYYREWREKESLVAQAVQSEVDWHERRQAILSGAADVQLPPAGAAAVGAAASALAPAPREPGSINGSRGGSVNGKKPSAEPARSAEPSAEPAAAAAEATAATA